MYAKLSAVNATAPPYSTRYPPLANLLEDDPQLPKGNAILRNICRGGRWLDLRNVHREWLTITDNITRTDPLFVNPGKGNFQLKDDSPAFTKGFKRIPLGKIGLHPGQYRAMIDGQR